MRRLILNLLFVPIISYAAPIFKCPGPDGQPRFQKSPCAADNQGEILDIKLPPPERLDRYRMESAERDARLAAKREKEAEQARKVVEEQARIAREIRWQQLDAQIQQDRFQAQQEHALLEWQIACRQARRLDIGSDCYNYVYKGQMPQ